MAETTTRRRRIPTAGVPPNNPVNPPPPPPPFAQWVQPTGFNVCLQTSSQHNETIRCSVDDQASRLLGNQARILVNGFWAEHEELPIAEKETLNEGKPPEKKKTIDIQK